MLCLIPLVRARQNNGLKSAFRGIQTIPLRGTVIFRSKLRDEISHTSIPSAMSANGNQRSSLRHADLPELVGPTGRLKGMTGWTVDKDLKKTAVVPGIDFRVHIFVLQVQEGTDSRKSGTP